MGNDEFYEWLKDMNESAYSKYKEKREKSYEEAMNAIHFYSAVVCILLKYEQVKRKTTR